MTYQLQLVLRPESLEILDCANPQQRLGLIGVGQAILTTRFFDGDTINPGRLEHAIEWTEDQIQAARTNIPAGAQLVTSEDDLRELAWVSGVSPSPHMVLHVEAVEATFSRLVMQAFGQAPHQEALPRSARFFATVVFIRELMHHLHFPQIHVVDRRSLPPPVGPSGVLSAPAL
jgi:exopolyphosphatase/pppGpp-phosphohydrolase